MQAHLFLHHQFTMPDMVMVLYSLTTLIAVVLKDHLMSVALDITHIQAHIQAHIATTFMM